MAVAVTVAEGASDLVTGLPAPGVCLLAPGQQLRLHIVPKTAWEGGGGPTAAHQ